MSIAFKQIILNPGEKILLQDVSWSQFESLLEELGLQRNSRLGYSHGLLEIMVPLPEHEKAKEIISDMVKILLDELHIKCESLGSTTFKNPAMSQAVEPDSCFYIANFQAVINQDRIDLSTTPPPDLAIEIDISSRTRLENYRILGVPELWRYNHQGIEIKVLENGEYISYDYSPNFPQFPQLKEIINQAIKRSKQQGRSQTLWEFRDWVKQQISP